MIKPKFYGIAKNGQFILDPRELENFRRYMLAFKEGQEMEMTVARKYKRRTSGQPGEETNFNGYYWAVVVRIISDTMGELDDNVTHSLLQTLFNKKGISVIDPETKKRISVEIPRGTRDLSGGEFADYCSRIRIWAAIPGNLCEGGCYIPDPNEADYE